MGNRRKAAIQPSDLRPEALCATKIAPGVQFFSEMSVSERDHMTVQDDHDQAESTFVSNGPTAERQGAVTTPGVDRTPCTRPSPQTIFIIILIVINVILIILLGTGAVLPNRTEQPSYNPVFAECCPYNWTGFRNKCYYFSEEEGDWNSSYMFCFSNNASLARIEEDEKAYCKLHDMKRSYWIGVQPGMGETRKWLNGDTATMKVIGTGKCAYWKAQDENATASRCTSAHQWICSISVKSKNHDEI
ncbi:C-type lectin domain family 2 member B-like isoform X3 [Podarcis raffonei]|uniref:C-type lectin domain family 2 member B-like isoform X3 n=1 Tax=Podarcis raffonei TaxID=65483 RepID=UPI0023296FDD|nr:C-type lectin domain family 2 member B-like isoform X3 [Podarcis raffonei]